MQLNPGDPVYRVVVDYEPVLIRFYFEDRGESVGPRVRLYLKLLSKSGRVVDYEKGDCSEWELTEEAAARAYITRCAEVVEVAEKRVRDARLVLLRAKSMLARTRAHAKRQKRGRRR